MSSRHKFYDISLMAVFNRAKLHASRQVVEKELKHTYALAGRKNQNCWVAIFSLHKEIV